MNQPRSWTKALLLCCCLLCFNARAQNFRERICGKWESEQHNLRIHIYMENNQFKAKIIWFSDTEGKPMSYWRDVRNPDPKLRSRKILGMSILSGLKYNRETDSWEGGSVYDSRHGRYWSAAATIGKKGKLRVRGYWHFKFLGKTITFYRIR
jgi:uncharacterized protein (DUF2147 family)